MPNHAMTLKVDSDATLMDHVVSLEYAESIDQLDTLRATLVMESHSDTSAVVTLLQPGAPFTIELLTDDAVVTEGGGDLLEVRHHRKSNGRHAIHLVGVDKLHRLSYGAPVAKMWMATHDQIVKDIASAHGLTGTADGVDTTEGYEFQHDVTDAVFVKQLARKYNYYVRVVADELLWTRRAGADAVTVDYNVDVIEAKLGASLHGIVTKVTVWGGDYITDEVVTYDSTSTDLQEITGTNTGVSIAESAFGEIALVMNGTGAGDSTAVTAIAKAELQRRAEKFVDGTIVVKGMPTAVSGCSLTIENAPWPFAGTFLIKQTRHLFEIGTGYRTYIDFCSDSLPDAT